jgi:hypothetical protein
MSRSPDSHLRTVRPSSTRTIRANPSALSPRARLAAFRSSAVRTSLGCIASLRIRANGPIRMGYRAIGPMCQSGRCGVVERRTDVRKLITGKPSPGERPRSYRGRLRRQWLHHVALPAATVRGPARGSCGASRAPCPRRRLPTAAVVVFCFARPEDARAFADRVDG